MSNSRPLYKKLVAEKTRRTNGDNLEDGLYILPSGEVSNVKDNIHTILTPITELSNLDDVSINGITNDQILYWDGTKFRSKNLSNDIDLEHLSSAERDLIQNPEDGRIIYNTDSKEINIFTDGVWGFVSVRPYYAHIELTNNSLGTVAPASTEADVPGSYVKFKTDESAPFIEAPVARNFILNSESGELTYQGPDLPNIPCEVFGRFVFKPSGSNYFMFLSVTKNGVNIGVPTIFETRGTRVQTEFCSFITTLLNGDVIGFAIATGELSPTTITPTNVDITVK